MRNCDTDVYFRYLLLNAMKQLKIIQIDKWYSKTNIKEKDKKNLAEGISPIFAEVFLTCKSLKRCLIIW